MEPLLPGHIYHIYNHSNGDDLLFREDENYVYFIEKYRKYILPVTDTFSYCLMPNHFHILVRIKEKEDIISAFNKSFKRKYDRCTLAKERENLVSLFVSKQFSNLFSSYTQAFNKMYDRMGSLFMKNFKRKRIEDEDYYTKMITYIHLNPVRHTFVSKPEDWNYSSYKTILSDAKTWLEKEEVINSFSDRDNFIYCHLEELNKEV
ncbi:MAG: hypothetical protein DRI88_05250 [Bacteroidetes bacterium]|nr:MAG: hypothetical protein DRI72_09955 [Bacteroidota bacterium]RLD47791.1 MAG: hypothetical protein DRI88_05250 [Bacteroidota bacterium]RLD74145.1 MAG: hypothetical protein DRI87_01915 [Bacteroidota bacterium]RLD89051.1 MAG: hypothetical protein DRJ02_02465 [Bacteroidota bacterium]